MFAVVVGCVECGRFKLVMFRVVSRVGGFARVLGSVVGFSRQELVGE